MTSKCCREKAVLVAVYAERPKRRLTLSENNKHHHHHHYHHFHDNISENDGTRRKGYNRRAELLDYARHLRSSQIAASASTTSSSSSYIAQKGVNIPTATEKPKRSSPQSCLDKWKFVIPRFLRNTRVLKISKGKEKKKPNKGESAATKMKALVRKLEVKKKGRLLSQLLKKLQKRR